MSLSQLSGKQGIHYASKHTDPISPRELRHKKSPVDQQSFGLFDELRRPSVDMKHQRAKSTLENKQNPPPAHHYSYLNSYQNSYRTPHQELDELEGEKLFDQFFRLNNSKSDSDFLRSQQHEPDFLKFVERAIEYHHQAEGRTLAKPQRSNMEQKLKSQQNTNQLLKMELHQQQVKLEQVWKQHKQQKDRLKKENQILKIQCQTLQEQLIQVQMEFQNAINYMNQMKKKCKCQSRYEYLKYSPEESLQTHLSSELSEQTEEDSEYVSYNFFDQRRRKSTSKVGDSLSQNSEDQQMEFYKRPKDLFQRKKYQDTYHIEEENTINSQ